MKAGDLVTLSSYALKKSDLWKWKIERDAGKQLVGLVVKVEENPRIHSWTSKNESTYYYINWINKNGPVSRWGSAAYYRNSGYFLRNDLKFVK